MLPEVEQKAGPQPPFPGRDVRGKQGPKAVNGPHYQEKWPRKEMKEIQKKLGIFRSPSHNREAAIHPQFLLSGLSGEAPHEEPGTGG